MGWLVLVCGLAFFLAWNLGANDVSNAMGTSVGAKVVTLGQAIVLAGCFELAGAIFLGQEVTTTLTGKITHLQLFEGNSHLFTLSAVAQLLGTSVWLWCATAKGWPVASSHAAVGAITGVSLVAFGMGALEGETLGTIALAWVLTPLVSGLCSVLFWTLLQQGLLKRSESISRWVHWAPWLSVVMVGLVGGLVLPTALGPLIGVGQQRGWSLSPQAYVLGMGGLAVLGLTHWTWQAPQGNGKGDRPYLEEQLGKFQIISACCMAFAHGSNDVGHAVAPLASYVQFWQTQNIPSASFQTPIWILALGAVGIVGGLATWGKAVITTVGEKFMTLQPSDGLCAELGAAITVLLASRLGLPISTTHALIGSVVGIGLMQGTGTLQWATVRHVGTAWVITIPVSMALAATFFVGLQALFPN